MRCAAVCVIALALAPAAAASEFTLELTPPRPARYGDAVTLRGRVTPALGSAPVTILRDGTPVATAVTRLDGTFAVAIRALEPAAYSAVAGELSTPPVALAVHPRVDVRVIGSRVVGRPLRVDVRVRPRGPARVEIRRGRRVTLARTIDGTARLGLGTRRPAQISVHVETAAGDGWGVSTRAVAIRVRAPRLALGSRGPSVRALEQRLRELRFALPRTDGVFGHDTHEAVLAFQKLHRLPWTGRVDRRTWRALARAHAPRPRYPGTHVEISKGRQYLLLVRQSAVELVVHVSTGATGNTPIGSWRVYRKVPGWDWILWYPMYFLRGFAIHGYPSVPAYPASHGCVRVPMWVAPRLYDAVRWGGRVYVYW